MRLVVELRSRREPDGSTDGSIAPKVDRNQAIVQENPFVHALNLLQRNWCDPSERGYVKTQVVQLNCFVYGRQDKKDEKDASRK